MEESRQALLLAEKKNVSYADILSLWEIAKETIQSEEDVLTLYTTFIYMTRRYIDLSDNIDYNPVERLFAEAIALVGDSQDAMRNTSDLRKNFAFFLYSKSKKVNEAREIWNKMLKEENRGWLWLEAIMVERAYGNIDDNRAYVRELFLRAVNQVVLNCPDLYKAYVQFEREEGTIEQLEYAIQKVNQLIHQQIQGGRSQKITKRKTNGTEAPNKLNKRVKKSGEEVGHKEETAEIEEQQFVNSKNDPIYASMSTIGPQMPGQATAREFQEETMEKASGDSQQKMAIDREVQESNSRHSPRKRYDSEQSDESMQSETTTNTAEPNNPDCTIYIANIDFNCTEQDISKWFENIKSIRIPHRIKSRANKGFAFVEFLDCESAQKAVEKDGQILYNNRKVLISEYKSNKMGKSEFRYNTGLEKNKLFIRNLHYDSNEDELRDAFSVFGALKSVRIITHFNGTPKGIAYVEFDTEEAAARALAADGTKIRKRKISVQLSNPAASKISKDKPARTKDHSKQNAPNVKMDSNPTNESGLSLMGTSTQRYGRASRLQLMPRSINKSINQSGVGN